MFKKEKNNMASSTSSSAQTIETIIGEGTVFEGTVTASSALRIDGTLKGEILSNNAVIIGETGHILGNVKSAQLYVSGTMDGNVEASEKVQFAASGCLRGDVTTYDLIIDQGATFVGKCSTKNKARKDEPSVSQPVGEQKSKSPSSSEKS
ncbi:MAG: polymer-forming cytoskeletal protein [Oscillospiraceae bacterium]